MKEIKDLAYALEKHVEKQKRKHRKQANEWRKKNPEAARQIYRRWAIKLKGPDFKPRKLGAYCGAFDKNFQEEKLNEQ